MVSLSLLLPDAELAVVPFQYEGKNSLDGLSSFQETDSGWALREGGKSKRGKTTEQSSFRASSSPEIREVEIYTCELILDLLVYYSRGGSKAALISQRCKIEGPFLLRAIVLPRQDARESSRSNEQEQNIRELHKKETSKNYNGAINKNSRHYIPKRKSEEKDRTRLRLNLTPRARHSSQASSWLGTLQTS